jgi:DNA repair exonuclease SbcCD nuclease subunit
MARSFRFVHAADLHVDSPLLGLRRYDGAPIGILGSATRRAFENLIDLCLEVEAAFLLIAGDLFDGDWRDMNTGLFAAQQLRRLGDTPVFLIRGNHDARSQISRELRFPDNVREFSSDAPETVLVPDLGVAIHGQSFAQREVTENLAAGYPPAREGHLNIGLLHTSLTGSPDHDTYAPARVDDLLARGYDYWALGHIHQHQLVRERPWIVFAGNTQARHLRERGRKGCMVIEVGGGEILEARFEPLDVARWYSVALQLGRADTADDLYRRVRSEIDLCHDDADGRVAAIRVIVTGSCAAHASLASAKDRSEADAEIRNIAADVSDHVWIERVSLATRPPVEVEPLREGQDLLGDLLRLAGATRENPGSREDLLRDLAPLLDKAGAEIAAAGIDVEDPERLKSWIEEAESLLLTTLGGDEE